MNQYEFMKFVIPYLVLSKSQAKKTKGYDARKAELLLRDLSEDARIAFCHRPGELGCRIPSPSALGVSIVYVKATGGKWGKSAEVRFL